MVLGKHPVRPTSLDNSTARAYCVCGMCEWELFVHFPLYSFSLVSFPLGDGPI